MRRAEPLAAGTPEDENYVLLEDSHLLALYGAADQDSTFCCQ